MLATLGIIQSISRGLTYTPPLDTYTGAAAAYSMRKLITAYSGSAIRVRRSSDNTEQDIGFTSSGTLDESSLTTFVGANSGYVTKWYDQSGNARDAAQATSANQPRIVNAGTVDKQNSKPTIVFNGSSYQLSSTQIFSSGSGNYSALAVAYGDKNSTLYLEQGGESNGTNIQLGIWTSGEAQNTWWGSAFYAGSIINNRKLIYSGWDGTNRIICINGTSYNQSSSSKNTSNADTIIGAGYFAPPFSGYANHWSGNIQELIIYNSNQSSNRTGIESNINSYYSIY